MSLDFEKINQRINDIDENIEEVKEYVSLSDNEFWKDRRNILAVKHLLLEAIEAVGAICLHLSAHRLKKSAEGMTDCFQNLQQAGLIDESLFKKLKAMSDFRNKLVHHYHKIEDKKVLKYAREDLDDFDQFIKAIGDELNI